MPSDLPKDRDGNGLGPHLPYKTHSWRIQWVVGKPEKRILVQGLRLPRTEARPLRFPSAVSQDMI